MYQSSASSQKLTFRRPGTTKRAARRSPRSRRVKRAGRRACTSLQALFVGPQSLSTTHSGGRTTVAWGSRAPRTRSFRSRSCAPRRAASISAEALAVAQAASEHVQWGPAVAPSRSLSCPCQAGTIRVRRTRRRWCRGTRGPGCVGRGRRRGHRRPLAPGFTLRRYGMPPRPASYGALDSVQVSSSPDNWQPWSASAPVNASAALARMVDFTLCPFISCACTGRPIFDGARAARLNLRRILRVLVPPRQICKQIRRVGFGRGPRNKCVGGRSSEPRRRHRCGPKGPVRLSEGDGTGRCVDRKYRRITRRPRAAVPRHTRRACVADARGRRSSVAGVHVAATRRRVHASHEGLSIGRAGCIAHAFGRLRALHDDGYAVVEAGVVSAAPVAVAGVEAACVDVAFVTCRRRALVSQWRTGPRRPIRLRPRPGPAPVAVPRRRCIREAAVPRGAWREAAEPPVPPKPVPPAPPKPLPPKPPERKPPAPP